MSYISLNSEREKELLKEIATLRKEKAILLEALREVDKLVQVFEFHGEHETVGAFRRVVEPVLAKVSGES